MHQEGLEPRTFALDASTVVTAPSHESSNLGIRMRRTLLQLTMFRRLVPVLLLIGFLSSEFDQNKYSPKSRNYLLTRSM